MTNEAFGRPISGDVTYYSENPVEQQDPQLWIKALDELFELDVVSKVKWRQYTPYFNDGDPCTFSAYGVSVLLKGLSEDEAENGNGFGDYGDNFIEAYSLRYDSGELKVAGVDVDLSESGELYQKLRHFEGETEGGSHYVMLLKTFGDPAEVTATREGFDVEFYNHD